jgi:CelD/BcsL family acetyltransferase involved in cellulose biosynthesis
MPRIALLSAVEAAGLAGEWQALAAEAVEDNHFFLADIVLAASRHFARDVRTLSIRNGEGALIGLAPVTATRLGRLTPALRIWSHHYGPFGVPLIAGGDLVEAASRFVEAAPTLVFPDLPLDSPVASALTRAAEQGGRMVSVVDAHERAALFRPSTHGDMRASIPTRRRKEYARQMRRLADLGPVAIESIGEPAAVVAAFEEFLILEAAGWKGRGETAILSNPPIAAFAREVVARRAAEGGVRIDALRLDGKPIAMVVTFLAGAGAWTWKIAFDEAFARFSPGAQLMLELPGHLFAHGKVARIDSLASANHPMIDHLWPDRIRIGTLVIGPRGPLHRLALLSVESEIRARALARQLRDRLRRRGHKETSA